jgi:hypothetical protein
MSNKTLKILLEEEFEDIEAPAEIKDRVSKSIDRLLLLKCLMELYTSIPAIAIQSLSQKNRRGSDNTH